MMQDRESLGAASIASLLCSKSFPRSRNPLGERKLARRHAAGRDLWTGKRLKGRAAKDFACDFAKVRSGSRKWFSKNIVLIVQVKDDTLSFLRKDRVTIVTIKKTVSWPHYEIVGFRKRETKIRAVA
jgi:hypothetical protein